MNEKFLFRLMNIIIVWNNSFFMKSKKYIYISQVAVSHSEYVK